MKPAKQNVKHPKLHFVLVRILLITKTERAIAIAIATVTVMQLLLEGRIATHYTDDAIVQYRYHATTLNLR